MRPVVKISKFWGCGTTLKKCSPRQTRYIQKKITVGKSFYKFMNYAACGSTAGLEGKFLTRISWTLSSDSSQISLGRKPRHSLYPWCYSHFTHDTLSKHWVPKERKLLSIGRSSYLTTESLFCNILPLLSTTQNTNIVTLCTFPELSSHIPIPEIVSNFSTFH